MVFEQTYSVVPGPAAPSFERYVAEATAAYQTLLDSAPDEGAVQSFLERNPCFVPRASQPGSHGPLFDALVSQPVLPGLRSKIPDFMWITSHSAQWFPTLIEIENPQKPLFRKDRVPTAEFSQARNQLAQWRAWFSEPANVQKFILEYGVPDHFTRYLTMTPSYVRCTADVTNSRETQTFRSSAAL